MATGDTLPFIRRILKGGAWGMFLLATSGSAEAQNWGVGAAVSPWPALSLQYQKAANRAYHGTFYFGEDKGLASGDVQFTHSLSPGQWTETQLYAGGGLKGTYEPGRSEQYWGRVPLGVQVKMPEWRLHTFLEAAAEAGPLPDLALRASVQGGMRTPF